MRKHYLDQYIAQAQHKITVDLVGAGGTGSRMLSNLAMISKSMVGLGRQPLYVRVFDPDRVEPHNIGRQAFSEADIGLNKAEVLVNRMNRFHGFDWKAYPEKFGKQMACSNFTVSCVDSVLSRYEIQTYLRKYRASRTDYMKSFYWMDIGNSLSGGQVILSTTRRIDQPDKYTKATLPDFFDEFPNAYDNPEEPSCSMAESLARQDLFINIWMASIAGDMLWNLLKNYYVQYRIVYLNIARKTMSMVPL